MKRWTALAGLAIFGATSAANAAVSDAQFRQLQQKLEQALKRIDQLEEQQAVVGAVQQGGIAVNADADVAVADQAVENSAKRDRMSWSERTRIEGDFRYRYQNDDVGSPVDDSRNRNRIRARAAIISSLDPELEVGFGLASGDNGDPVSSNQTLGDAGSDKDVSIDLAYFSWTGIEDTAIRGGKFKNTFQIAGGSQLQWDNDWRPEGAGIAWSNGTFFAQGAGVYLESDSNQGNSEFAYIVQAGARGKVGPVALMGGVGYTDIDASGAPCYFNTSSSVPSAAGLCQGNQAVGVVPDQTYLYDFNVYNVFAQADLDVGGLPLTFYVDYVNNGDADDYEQGYLIGAQLGALKAKGNWQVGYYYEDLESNATLGLLTNSDFGGGGTNGKGSVFNVGYALSDKTNVQATYQLIDRNSDGILTINGGDDINVKTLQLDLNFKYK